MGKLHGARVQDSSTGSLLGQFLQGVFSTAHPVISQFLSDIYTTLSGVKLQGGFVPVQNDKVHLRTPHFQAQLKENIFLIVLVSMKINLAVKHPNTTSSAKLRWLAQSSTLLS